MNENKNTESITIELTEKSDAPKKSNRGILGVIVVILIALVVGIAIYNTPANRLSRQLDLGNRYLEEQNYEQAIVEFDKAIKIDPMSVEAYLGKAQAYVDLGDIDMTLQTLEEGLERTGNEQIKDRLVECYLNQANEYTRKTDYKKALEIYDRLLELDSENIQVDSDLGNCLLGYLNLLIEQGRYDEVRVIIEKYKDKASGIDFQDILAYIEELEQKTISEQSSADIEIQYDQVTVQENSSNDEGLKLEEAFKLLELINQWRIEDGLPELTWSTVLEKEAQMDVTAYAKGELRVLGVSSITGQMQALYDESAEQVVDSFKQSSPDFFLSSPDTFTSMGAALYCIPGGNPFTPSEYIWRIFFS